MPDEKTKVLILGSGIGGLSAGAELVALGEQDFLICEAAPSLPLNLGNGVHYLHTDKIKFPFPFELKKISFTEEIWNPRTDEFKSAANLPEMIDYSMKVMGTRHPSSIMHPGPLQNEAFLPGSYRMNDLLTAYASFIGLKFRFGRRLIGISRTLKIAHFQDGEEVLNIKYEKIISTVPLPLIASFVGMDCGDVFKNLPIFITNYETENIVGNWLIALYIADILFPVYRITILNNSISMESMQELCEEKHSIVKYHLSRYFDYSLKTRSEFKWTNGRIFGFNNSDIRANTMQYFESLGIHLVGRFARWDGKLRMDTTIEQAQETVKNIL